MPDIEDLVEEPTQEDESVVRREVERVRGFVQGLSMDELRGGAWFAKLLTFSLGQYVHEVDASYFREKYPDLPVDAVAGERIQIAARYASVEGGLTAAAYTGAVAATIGSGGGASPLTLPAGGATFVVDLVYTSQLQLRLAHDLAVLYGVPLNTDDPDDLWKLIRIAFAIKSGEVGRSAVAKGVPAIVRPVVKKIFSGGTLAAAKSLPVVGKHLLRRNIIKFAVPGVGVPVSAGVNYWTTKTAGLHAKKLFRDEARLAELAHRFVGGTEHPHVLPWVLWAVSTVDGPVVTSQNQLLHHVTADLREQGVASAALDELRDVVDVDHERVWDMLRGADGDLVPLYRAGVTAAVVSGKVSRPQFAHLQRLAETCGAEFDAKGIREQARSWS